MTNLFDKILHYFATDYKACSSRNEGAGSKGIGAALRGQFLAIDDLEVLDALSAKRFAKHRNLKNF